MLCGVQEGDVDMQRIRLIHWDPAEAGQRAQRLQAAGYEVDSETLDGAGLRRLRDDPPDAVVIDLGRRPSQGRDVGLTLRKYVATRRVPLVFVGGVADKVARVREFLPDAVYTTWDKIHGALALSIRPAPSTHATTPRWVKTCDCRIRCSSGPVPTISRLA